MVSFAEKDEISAISKFFLKHFDYFIIIILNQSLNYYIKRRNIVK